MRNSLAKRSIPTRLRSSARSPDWRLGIEGGHSSPLRAREDLDVQFDHHRHVVGRLFPAAHMLVDPCADEAGRRPAATAGNGRCGCRCSSARRRPGNPRTCRCRAGRGGADGIGEAESHAGAGTGRGSPAGTAHRPSQPPGCLASIGVGNDIEVAGQHQRLFEGEQFAAARDEPVHPGELVGVFVRVRRIAVGQIDRGDAHAYRACRQITASR